MREASADAGIGRTSPHLATFPTAVPGTADQIGVCLLSESYDVFRVVIRKLQL